MSAPLTDGPRASRALPDEGGHTLVELSVYLVLAVLVVGLAFAAATAAHRGVAAWTTSSRLTNAMAGAVSRLDADLRRAEAVTAVGPSEWRIVRAGARPLTYRSVEGRVLRDGRRLHPEGIEATLVLEPPASPCRPGTCLVRARLAVRAAGPDQGGPVGPTAPPSPLEWHVLLPLAPWPPAP